MYAVYSEMAKRKGRAAREAATAATVSRGGDVDSAAVPSIDHFLSCFGMSCTPFYRFLFQFVDPAYEKKVC